VIVCLRCGEKNPADTQFCGGCGAFLEWRGEARPDHAPVADDRVDPSVGAESVVPLIRCLRCGSANAQSRTFCQSCGERLSKVVPPEAGIQTSTTAANTAQPAIPPRPGGQSQSAGSWLPFALGGGLIIGIALAGFALFRGGDGVQSTAPDEPTPGASASPPASVSSSLGGSDTPADVTLAAGMYVDLDGGVLTREDGDDVDLLWGVAGTEGVLHARNGAQLGLLPPPDRGHAELCREVVETTPVIDISVRTLENQVLCVVTNGDQVGRLTIERPEGTDLTMNYGVFTD